MDLPKKKILLKIQKKTVRNFSTVHSAAFQLPLGDPVCSDTLKYRRSLVLTVFTLVAITEYFLFQISRILWLSLLLEISKEQSREKIFLTKYFKASRYLTSLPIGNISIFILLFFVDSISSFILERFSVLLRFH